MTEQTEGLKPLDLDALIDRLNDMGAVLGRGQEIGNTPYAVACWHDIAAATTALRDLAAARPPSADRADLTTLAQNYLGLTKALYKIVEAAPKKEPPFRDPVWGDPTERLANRRGREMSAESGTWDYAGWYFSASHRDPVRQELHGHSYEVVAWWPTGQDAVELQNKLKAVLTSYDHKTLPDELSQGHMLAKAIGQALKGCVGVDISRPVERIGARWRL